MLLLLLLLLLLLQLLLQLLLLLRCHLRQIVAAGCINAYLLPLQKIQQQHQGERQ